MKVRTVNKSEADTCRCKYCGGRSAYLVTDRDEEGITGGRYLCTVHFTEFNRENTVTTYNCQWCNDTVTKVYETERYMDSNPGRRYRVCRTCYDHNQGMIEDAMEEDFDEEDNIEDPNED